jgi:hypothetical protein
MEWAGYVRQLSRKYNRTVVVSYAGHSCLYEGCEFYPHDLKLEASGYWYGSLTADKIRALAASYARGLKLTSFDWLHPTHLNRYTKSLIGAQLLWPPLERSRCEYRYEVAFHFRSLRREDLDEKNYPLEFAIDLVRRCSAQGMRVGCIGHPVYSLCPEGCDDLRSADLGDTRETLKTIRLVVGGSSAPMHLASLCGLPIVVWWKEIFLTATLAINIWASGIHTEPLCSSFLIRTSKSRRPRSSHVY